MVHITSWGSHTELGFLNTSPPHCIALLWIQEMSPSLSVIAVSYDPELSHFSQLSWKCSDDDKDSGYRQSRWGQGSSDSIFISQETVNKCVKATFLDEEIIYLTAAIMVLDGRAGDLGPAISILPLEELLGGSQGQPGHCTLETWSD